MMKTCKVLLAALAWLTCAPASRAQTGKLFDADNQLPSSFTNQVYLDHDGFVWVASRNGLSRYDGYQFRIFKKGQGTNMASNYVNAIAQDSRGLFWVGMYGALQTYDGMSFRDVAVVGLDGQRVPGYITCFVERRSGEMLVGTSGHGVLRVTADGEARQVGGDLKAVKTVNSMSEDRLGRTWIATDALGLIAWDGRGVVGRYFQQEPICRDVQRVAEDHEGHIYAGIRGRGVYRLEADGQFHHLEATGSHTITELYCNQQGQILMGFDGGGMGIFDPTTDQLAENPFYTRETDLSKAKVESIVEDRNGNIWMGLLQKGLFMQPASHNKFYYTGYKLGTRNIIGQACVTSTLADSRGRVWVGTDKDGLYRLNGDYRHFSEGFPATVLTMAEDAEGRVWLGTYREGCGYVDATGHYHRQPLPQGEHVSVFGMATDNKGHVWMGTMGEGLLCLTLADGSVRQWTTQPGATTDRTVNSLTNDYIQKLAVSEDGRRVYLATTMGVCCLDTEHDSWTSVFGGNCLDYGTSALVVREFDGALWVGRGDGLYRYDLRTRQLSPAGGATMLASNGIASMERDHRGRLWVGTDHGLCCYDPLTQTAESYFVDNGLQSNEFSDGASSAAASGLMYFGGVGGITWFDPQEISQQAWNAEVKLIGFTLNGQPVNSQTRSGAYRVCDTTAIAAERFQLAYHENHFSIQLSTLTYDSPEHITYLYRINDEPFTSLQRGVNEITFTHLAPGTYRFSIKAERNNQQTAERRFTVVVHAPWWRTWWAMALYLVAAGLALWQYQRQRKRKEQARLRLQEHIHAEEMADAKLKFFMNIGHEIRIPMTLILTPLEKLRNMKTDQLRSADELQAFNATVLQPSLSVMRRNAERILNLVNQMMDLRKIDKGMMQMQMQQTDLVAFAADIYALFGHQAQAKHISFAYEHEDSELPVWIDRQQFDKVIVNILSNAFKFTPADGQVTLRVERMADRAEVSVSDNGEQIPPEQLERIFERFYQSPAHAATRNAGTGIGLDLARSLVELHHGTITAHNLEQGCEFVVSIPLGNAHLTPEELAPAESAPAPEPATAETPAEPPTPQTTGRPLVVVAEDDDDIRAYLQTELEADFDVRACHDGREALAESLRLLPSLVITDVMMPQMDGNTLCATLKSNPQASHIPVILLTARTREEDQLQGLETGADAYILKPFNMDILRRTAHNLIHSRQQLRLKYARNDQLEEQVDPIQMRSPDEKLLERIMKAINQNLKDSELSVDSIAAQVGISRVHLHRKMKELTGQTPHDFIRNLRLKQAAHLLASGDMNVTEVVYACGFGNATSFSTTFKKFYGMTPREYMQEHQKR